MAAQMISAKEYHAGNISMALAFQNEDGSLKKSGFVVIFEGQRTYFKTKKAAEEFQKNPVKEEIFVRPDSWGY